MPIQSTQTVAAPNSTIASGNRMLRDLNHFVMEDRAPLPFQAVLGALDERTTRKIASR
jgi:hypothetical protein